MAAHRIVPYKCIATDCFRSWAAGSWYLGSVIFLSLRLYGRLAEYRIFAIAVRLYMFCGHVPKVT